MACTAVDFLKSPLLLISGSSGGAPARAHFALCFLGFFALPKKKRPLGKSSAAVALQLFHGKGLMQIQHEETSPDVYFVVAV